MFTLGVVKRKKSKFILQIEWMEPLSDYFPNGDLVNTEGK